MFKKLEINISFADALAQMPNYMKFRKEMMSNKRKLEAYGTVNLSGNCSAIIQRKLPKKMKDSGSFTLPCVIRSITSAKHCVIWCQHQFDSVLSGKEAEFGRNRIDSFITSND